LPPPAEVAGAAAAPQQPDAPGLPRFNSLCPGLARAAALDSRKPDYGRFFNVFGKYSRPVSATRKSSRREYWLLELPRWERILAFAPQSLFFHHKMLIPATRRRRGAGDGEAEACPVGFDPLGCL
jgi:hypothetical protein